MIEFNLKPARRQDIDDIVWILQQHRPIGLGFYTTHPHSSIYRQSPPPRYIFL